MMNEKELIVAPAELRHIVSSEDRIIRYENNLVTLLTAEGESMEALEPRRLFPVSRRNIYISLLDGSGVERGLVRAISDLDDGSQRVLTESLDDYYLVPKITKIRSISEKSGTVRFEVETDRGEKHFDVRNRHHDIRLSHDGMVRVRDSDDNRYEIDDYKKLDKKSRAKLITYL